jgi:UDP-N-acetylmuramate--alanine ligase
VQGHDPSHVDGARALVVTAAVSPTHPELARARELGVPVVPRKAALAALIGTGRSVAVAGTHGKTTTTVMTTEALTAAGLAPTGIAGGRVSAWGGNARMASDALFVVEADEYDRAFLELHPTIAVVNNVEPDHLECYGSMETLEKAFAEFAGRLDRRRRFGFAEDAEVRITGVTQHADRTEAEVRFVNGHKLPIRLRVPGIHNLRNAVAALAVVEALGGDLVRAAEALSEFTGVGRRFERLGEHGGVALVDDYAHHPTELAATLAAARQAYPGRRLVAVFQPHLYSRTAAHAEAMGRALAAADLAIVTEIYAAREQPMAGVSGRQVADAAQRAGAEVRFEPTRAELGRRVYEALAPGDVVITLGAGDITRVGPELLRWLDAA